MDFCLFVCFVVKLGRMHSNMVASIQEPNYRSLFISFLKNKNVNEVFETHGGQKPWTQQKSWDIMCFLVYTPVVLLCHVHPLDIPNQCNYFNWCPWACLCIRGCVTDPAAGFWSPFSPSSSAAWAPVWWPGPQRRSSSPPPTDSTRRCGGTTANSQPWPKTTGKVRVNVGKSWTAVSH